MVQQSQRRALKAVIVLTGIGALVAMQVACSSSTAAVAVRVPTEYDRTSVFAGSLRVTLLVPSRDTRVRSLLVQLWQGQHRLGNRHVRISLSRPLQPRVGSYALLFDGIAYRASLPAHRNGTWVADVSIDRASAPAHRVDVPFIIRTQPGNSPSLLIYPLFVPVNGWNTTLSLPFRQSVVTVRAVIASDGAARFWISFGGKALSEGRFSHLRLVLTMLDMNMGHLTMAARRTSKNVFLTRGFLSMPGAWSVRVTDGTDAATGVLLIGEHR